SSTGSRPPGAEGSAGHSNTAKAASQQRESRTGRQSRQSSHRRAQPATAALEAATPIAERHSPCQLGTYWCRCFLSCLSEHVKPLEPFSEIRLQAELRLVDCAELVVRSRDDHTRFRVQRVVPEKQRRQHQERHTVIVVAGTEGMPGSIDEVSI